MNVYFLVEGKTERKVYPKWLSYFLPYLSRVNYPEDAKKNNYYLISGGGYPSILDNHLVDSIRDINAVDGIYDYFETVRYLTNPKLKDTDKDGVLDGDEVFIYGTNPLM